MYCLARGGAKKPEKMLAKRKRTCYDTHSVKFDPEEWVFAHSFL
jgi:hypothetical protein